MVVLLLGVVIWKFLVGMFLMMFVKILKLVVLCGMLMCEVSECGLLVLVSLVVRKLLKWWLILLVIVCSSLVCLIMFIVFYLFLSVVWFVVMVVLILV